MKQKNYTRNDIQIYHTSHAAQWRASKLTEGHWVKPHFCLIPLEMWTLDYTARFRHWFDHASFPDEMVSASIAEFRQCAWLDGIDKVPAARRNLERLADLTEAF